MTTLLHIDSSASTSSSISRSLSNELVTRWTTEHPDTKVIRRDLGTSPALPAVSETWIKAAFTPVQLRTAEQRELLSKSDELIAELKAAQYYVFGVSMYNFGIPASLKLWIDQVVRVGETYQNLNGNRQGLLADKHAFVFVASGGKYEPGTPSAASDFVRPYLTAILAYMGITNVHFHSAGGTAILLGNRMTREEFLEPHLKSARELIKA